MLLKNTIDKIRTSLPLQAAIGLIFYISFVMAIQNQLPRGIDWYETYRPVGQALYHLKSPYSVEGFRAAPWASLISLPFAWLPEQTGRAAYFLVSLLAFSLVAIKLGAKPITLAVFLLSPPVLHCLLNANIDWLPLVGFILPPPIGIFFVAVKPQVGWCVAVFWIIQSLRGGKFIETIYLVAPISIVILISFVIFGFWPSRFVEPMGYWWNASLWPASIPIGMVFLASALLNRRIEGAMAASPFLSPYVLLHSWSGALLSLASKPVEMLAAVGGLWILVIIRAFS